MFMRRVGRVFEAHHVKNIGGPRRLGPPYDWFLMYKLLLCWRYLLTRYLALACIISVMLGVATLIVVNSVMSGFSTKLRERLHALLSDVVVESLHFDGMPDVQTQMERIRQDPFLSGRIEAMTPNLET